ncbi:hypothetical protein [Burkholderia gladioli]|jgi:hypothetical protein|uniref:hypothetical protein n=1 Tax=Burkholderia gladioli TaxID=28095 RepID=UPI001640C061|nr:hypothetical protein [Burkholderia gladioli]
MSTNRDSQRSLRSRRYWSPLRSRVSTAIVKSVYENLAADLQAYKHAVDQDDQPAPVQETRRAKINDAIGAAMLMFHTADHKQRVKAIKHYMRLASIKPSDTVLPGAADETDEAGATAEAAAPIGAHEEAKAPGESHEGSPFDFSSLAAMNADEAV